NVKRSVGPATRCLFVIDRGLDEYGSARTRKADASSLSAVGARLFAKRRIIRIRSINRPTATGAWWPLSTAAAVQAGWIQVDRSLRGRDAASASAARRSF